MAVQRVPAEEFLNMAEGRLVLDVRSPGEYAHAHIPGAHSLPLFTDEERKTIGTAYKQENRETAIKIGLDAFGPKMRRMVEAVESLLQSRQGEERRQTILVHCWRGGMRSAAVAWLLDLYGFDVCLLDGGYKAYRHWVINHWQYTGNVCIIGGNTGSGKTKVLHELRKLGASVIDLEHLASHKGSAFGALEGISQPTQEMFENLLARELAQTIKSAGNRPVWIEDESQRIGDVNIPIDFFRGLAHARRIHIDVSFERRLDSVVAEYRHLSTERLVNNIIRIKKRLGPLETKTAIAHLVEGDIKGCFAILLHYYDKHYYPAGIAGSISINGADKTALEIARHINTHYG